MRFVVTLLLLASLPGCQLPYLVTQLSGQTRLLASARSIDTVLADPATSPELRARLLETRELLDFARAHGFRVGDAYSTFAEPVEGYPVWIVSACPPDSLDAIAWEFPIVGSFPYRGFFRRRLAEHEAERLREEGLEVDLRPALAFSTLGWFRDPLLPTLLAGDAGERAGGILHELAHRTVFVPGDPRLNESISVSVEDFAVRAWLRERGETEALRTHAERCHDRERLRGEVARLLEELGAAFEAPERQERLRGKEEAIARFRARLAADPFRSARYARLAEVEWTLPALLLVDVYGGDGPLLEAVYRSVGEDLPAYLERLQEAAASDDPRARLEEWAEKSENRSSAGTRREEVPF